MGRVLLHHGALVHLLTYSTLYSESNAQARFPSSFTSSCLANVASHDPCKQKLRASCEGHRLSKPEQQLAFSGGISFLLHVHVQPGTYSAKALPLYTVLLAYDCITLHTCDCNSLIPTARDPKGSREPWATHLCP